MFCVFLRAIRVKAHNGADEPMAHDTASPLRLNCDEVARRCQPHPRGCTIIQSSKRLAVHFFSFAAFFSFLYFVKRSSTASRSRTAFAIRVSAASASKSSARSSSR